MKKRLLCMVLTALVAFAQADATDYRDKKNWVMCEADKPDAAFDVFYIYPTLFFNPITPLMDVNENPHLRERITNFTTEQVELIVPHARISRSSSAPVPAGKIRICSRRESTIRWRRSAIISSTSTAGARTFSSATARGRWTSTS